MRDTKRIIYFSKETASAAVRGLNCIIWPNRCLNCGSLTDEDNGWLCDDCWGQLNKCIAGDYCPYCGRNVSRWAVYQASCPKCVSETNIFDGIARVGIYDTVLQKIILAFKNGRTELAVFLEFLAGCAFRQADFKDEIDCYIPVPLHWTRRLKRGYNQSAVIAKRLFPSKKIKTCELVRIRRTKMQSDLASPRSRRKNVEGAFALRKDHTITGKTICLIDDIKTTGATINECSRVLKQSGAKKVYAVVLAVAGQRLK
jgi:ComF family protein